MHTRWIETAIRDGPTIKHEGFTATFRSWSLTASWPGGGFVWNRPHAVVIDNSGRQESIPIHNVTLLLQLALVALVAAVTFLYVVPSDDKAVRKN